MTSAWTTTPCAGPASSFHAFFETYTFKTISDDGLRLYVKPAGAGNWGSPLIDTWSSSGQILTSSGSIALLGGSLYDVKVEYRELTGTAIAQLFWASSSTPEEVIDTLGQSGINNPDWTAGYADIIKGARNSWEGTNGNPRPAVDASGWPMGDGSYVFQESLNQGLDVDPLMLGTIAFSFKGKADVSVWGNVDAASLVSSYNAATNTTTGSFRTQNRGINASYFHFRNSHRDGQPTGPGGITDLRLMRPTAPNATTSYDPSSGVIFTPQLRNALSRFTVIRHQYVANQQKEWSDRTLPGYFNQSGGSRTAPYYGVGDPSDNGPAWEYKIMLANETGRDLMLSIPTVASGRTAADTTSYIYNLANLIKYGSDGVNPYTSPQANPVYPPLNPNLRVYLEIENELWNWASIFATDFHNLNAITKADADANNADFQVINYDNLPTTKNGNGDYDSMGTWRYRKIVLRTMQVSDIFRSVFGDGAVTSRIRPVYQWQYDNANDTARLGLVWADRYFNNSDGVQHVATPRPLSYWLWGGGGATYYGAVNGNGLTTLLPNSGFDSPALPTGANWTFSGTAGIARDGGAGDDIPPAFNGSQMGYITDTGSMSINVTFPANQTSNLYALSFKALNRIKAGLTAADRQNIRVYLDDTIDITAKTFNQGNGYTPPGYNADVPWKAQNVFWTWSDYYYTKTFTVTPGSTHKITIKGMGDISTPTNTNQTAFLEDVRITSVDQIYADGIPGGGEATGQPAGQNYQNVMNVEANWAKAFGLEMLAYEGGWSLGGDDGGSWLQMKAKYGDSRTRDAQIRAMDMFHQSGSAINIFGTYPQWPSWADYYAEQGLLDVGLYPIMQGIADRMDHLPAEATNGVQLPGSLVPSNAVIWERANTSTAQITAAGGWIVWSVIVPRTGSYTLNLTTSGAGGSVVLLVDDATQVAAGVSGGTLGGTAFLTKGMHSIKVRSVSATAFTVTKITVGGQNAPASPVLSSAADGDRSASLTWGAVTGATGYRVRYGTSSGNYSNAIDVGNVTSHTVTGLTNNQQYFFAIDSYNASGESLPSNEKGVIPLAPGQVGRVGLWEFTGLAGNEATAPVSSSSSRLSISGLTRGSGLSASTSGWAAGMRVNRFASEPSSGAGNSYGADLAGAISKQQYYQFTIAALPGQTLSLESLAFRAFFQSGSGGAGVTYSTDGINFSGGIAATGSAGSSSVPWTVDLSGIGALQNTTATITIRIYLWGLGAYQVSALGDGSGDDLVITGSILAA